MIQLLLTYKHDVEWRE